MSDDMNEEQLILYYYNDGLSTAERRRIAAALERDDQLAERYQALCRDLDGLTEAVDAIAPEGLAHRLQSTIDRAARLEAAEYAEARKSPRFATRMLAWGSALAAALAVGVGAGLWLGEGTTPVAPGVVEVIPATSPEWSSAAFQRALGSHFRNGRLDLDSFRGESENGQGRAALVASLLQQNRLYAHLALQNDAPDLARVLRSFEPLLEQLGREDLSPQEAASLQAQLEFEFTVMLTKLTRNPSQNTEPHDEELSL